MIQPSGSKWHHAAMARLSQKLISRNLPRLQWSRPILFVLHAHSQEECALGPGRALPMVKENKQYGQVERRLWPQDLWQYSTA